MDLSDITDIDLQDEILCPSIIIEYRVQVTKRMEDVGYMNNLASYVSSIFEDSEIFSEQKLIRLQMLLVLDKYKSSFITYKLQPGTYIF